MDLLPTGPDHPGVVAGWPTSATEVAQWCGRDEFPVSARTVAAWQQEDGVRAFVLVEGGRPIAYGELWLDDEEDEAELARLLVAPEDRGRGVGRALVRALLAGALEAGFDDVFLRVHPDNTPALRCYHAAGFRPVAADLAREWNAAQPVDYVWLRAEE
ncbi:GNAT family N-acetyltransferase [Streptomyces sp. NPDC002640]